MTTDAPQRQDFRFHHRLRVRWAEVDMQKIVFNAHYLMYFDTAVADYWRALALPYEESMRSLGGDLFVKKATLEYHAAATLDDQLDVALRCTRVGNSSLHFAGALFRDNDLLTTIELIYVFADPVARRALPVPDALRQLLEGYEAGQDVTTLAMGNWPQMGPQASALRTEVFVHEQGVPADEEWDAADADALHAVVSNRLGRPLATGRLLREAPGVARIGRMAVSRMVRGGNLGQQVLQALMAQARERGDKEAVLSAQSHAVGFYARAGFVPYGEPFIEADIAHTHMRRSLV